MVIVGQVEAKDTEKLSIRTQRGRQGQSLRAGQGTKAPGTVQVLRREGKRAVLYQTSGARDWVLVHLSFPKVAHHERPKHPN